MHQYPSNQYLKSAVDNRDFAGLVSVEAVMVMAAELLKYRTTPASPSAPDGWATLPAKLSAENGAKAALSGEFLEVKFISCPECFGDDDCDSCDGSGRVKVEIPVSWTTIKAIWEKGVQHFIAAPEPGGE